ncbi:AAA family ATPase [Sulfitobacter sp. R18_1]|uniref:AAA family ATPase n=1 Tax=Sulfitobacter sp. R18_1 TaxID=2821104 RepID=UPI001ADC17E3|nr:AAA family ATPase [Sulfitobacter sp. R18_1]MBO9428410.1 AAA family ATPase [Sulfitobacter sp. R18_1]
MTTVTGIVKKVLKQGRPGSRSFVLIDYEDEDTGKLETARLGGFLGALEEGDAFDAEGVWNTSEYKGQVQHVLNARNIRPGVPKTTQGIWAYLRRQLNVGHAPSRRENLAKFIEEHQEKTIDAIIDDMDGFFDIIYSTFAGVIPVEDRGKDYLALRERFAMKLSGREAVDLMKGADLDEKSIDQVMSKFREKALPTLKSNPYEILDVPTIDFEVADRLAKQLGISEQDERRIIGALVHHLRIAENQGSSSVALPGAVEEVCDKLSLESDLVSDVLRSKINSDPNSKLYVASFPGYEHDVVLRKASLGHEVSAAQNIINMIRKGRRNDPAKVEAACATVLEGSILDEYQRAAVKVAVQHPISIITGGPGTGKSTITDAVIKASRLVEVSEIIVTAPTGKAATRAEETTGVKAQTVHRLLGMREGADGTSIYTRNKSNPLPENCVVIVDEVSMMDNELLAALLNAMPISGRLILQGDPNQLPSVGVGRVISDLMEINIDGQAAIPVGRLVNVYRQDKDSKIITDSHVINNGEVPDFSEGIKGGVGFVDCESREITENVLQIYGSQLKHIPSVDILKDVAVICPQGPGHGGTYEVNKALSEFLNPEGAAIPGMPEVHPDNAKIPMPRIGDRVMILDNNEALDVVNGDNGVLVGHRQDPDNPAKSLVEMELDNGRRIEISSSQWRTLTMSYAITSHKSQGSQYKFVLLPFSDMHMGMAKKSLVYTAWTRAKDFVIGIGEKQVLEHAVQNDEDKHRYTIMRSLVEAWLAPDVRSGKVTLFGGREAAKELPVPPTNAFRKARRGATPKVNRPSLSGLSSAGSSSGSGRRPVARPVRPKVRRPGLNEKPAEAREEKPAAVSEPPAPKPTVTPRPTTSGTPYKPRRKLPPVRRPSVKPAVNNEVQDTEKSFSP